MVRQFDHQAGGWEFEYGRVFWVAHRVQELPITNNRWTRWSIRAALTNASAYDSEDPHKRERWGEVHLNVIRPLVALYKIGGEHFRLVGTNGFQVKAESDLLLRARVVIRTSIWKFHVVVWQTTLKHCTKKRAAHAARLFFFIQPMKSLICGIVVDDVVVKS